MTTAREMIDAITTPEALSARSPRSREFVSSFALSLKRSNRLMSDKQRDLLVKLYSETIDPPKAPQAVEMDGIDGVRALFATGTSKGLKRPKIRLSTGEVSLRLSRAPDHGNNPGCIYVVDPTQVSQDGQPLYLGMIRPQGEFQPRREASPAHIDLLQAFGRDPAGVAAASGKLTGGCSFCAKGLTDERSLEVGYGPICATKYELPWGEREELSQAA